MTTSYHTASLTLQKYIDEYRDVDRFIKACHQCPNFGAHWGCPPFNFSTDSLLANYRHIFFVALRILPEESNLPLARWNDIVQPERIRLEALLLSLEKQFNGRAFGFGGVCPYCPQGDCARAQGLPCRHPQLVRSSLEAFGFDVERTAQQIIQTPIVWGKEGCLPPYITLVGALLHNDLPENVQRAFSNIEH